MIDHRATGWGRLDRDQYRATIQGLIDIAPSATVRVVAIIEIRPSLGLVAMTVTGTDEGGGAFDMQTLTILGARDGKLSQFENFAIHDIGAARARFEEVAAPDVGQYLEKVTKDNPGGDWDKREVEKNPFIWQIGSQVINAKTEGQKTMLPLPLNRFGVR